MAKSNMTEFKDVSREDSMDLSLTDTGAQGTATDEGESKPPWADFGWTKIDISSIDSTDLSDNTGELKNLVSGVGHHSLRIAWSGSDTITQGGNGAANGGEKWTDFEDVVEFGIMVRAPSGTIVVPGGPYDTGAAGDAATSCGNKALFTRTHAICKKSNTHTDGGACDKVVGSSNTNTGSFMYTGYNFNRLKDQGDYGLIDTSGADCTVAWKDFDAYIVIEKGVKTRAHGAEAAEEKGIAANNQWGLFVEQAVIDTIAFRLVVSNINYTQLVLDEALLEHFEDQVQTTIKGVLDGAQTGQTKQCMVTTTSGGGAFIDVYCEPLNNVAIGDTDQAGFWGFVEPLKTKMPNLVQSAINGIEHIDLVASGGADITVAEETNPQGNAIVKTEKATSANNIVQTNLHSVGGWGGVCTCPNGKQYLVGDNRDGCRSLACVGGTAGTCAQHTGDWSGRKVICYPLRNIVQVEVPGVGGWGGECVCPEEATGHTTHVHYVGDNHDSCGSMNCIGGESRTCNRYRGIWSGKRVICKYTNLYEKEVPGVGGWGGQCTCEDGQPYMVGDNHDGCSTFACVGGEMGTCHKLEGEWSRNKVTCHTIV